MQLVKFVKPWRGHALGKVVELTDSRATELLREKYCVAHVHPSPATVDKPASQDPPVDVCPTPEADPEAEKETTSGVEAVGPVTAATPRRRRRAIT